MQIVPPEFRKNTAQNSPKYAISIEEIHFLFCGGPITLCKPLTRWTPHLAPNQTFWIRLCIPQNATRFTPLSDLKPALLKFKYHCLRDFLNMNLATLVNNFSKLYEGQAQESLPHNDDSGYVVGTIEI